MLRYGQFSATPYLRDDVARVPRVVVCDRGGVDVVRALPVDHGVQDDAVVVVRELVRVAVLLLVLGLEIDSKCLKRTRQEKKTEGKFSLRAWQKSEKWPYGAIQALLNCSMF